MGVEEKLLETFRQMFVIDAHEHLMPESEYLTKHKDALTIYGQYTRLPMFASGLSQDDWRRMHDPELPLMKRWAIAKPYIDLVKHTSFARAARITMKAFWNVEELTEDNITRISDFISAENTPGLYDRVLRGKSRILHVLNQDTGQFDGRDLDVYQGQTILAAVVSLIDVKPEANVAINRLSGENAFSSLDDYLEWARERLKTMARQGALGFKTASYAFPPPDRRAAEEEFAELRRQGRSPTLEQPGPLFSYLHEELLRAAAPLGIVVAVHTGFWGVNRHDPAHFIPIIERHPAIHFDLFHSGLPYGRVMGSIAVNYANTSVNLCWAHSNNAAMTASALDEYIDQLGSDKIIAFGGDVRFMLEKVYGHLELARKNIASVLAGRIQNGLMDFDDAVKLAKMWFFENPARIYRLSPSLD